MSDVNKSISINFCDVALKIQVDIDTYNELFLNSFLNLILIHSVNNTVIPFLYLKQNTTNDMEGISTPNAIAMYTCMYTRIPILKIEKK